VRFMSDRTKDILSEVLLELTLVIGHESSFHNILRKTISFWLRRLGCTVGGLIQRGCDTNSIELQYIIPAYLKREPLDPVIRKTILRTKISFYEEIFDHGEFSYVFPVGRERYFWFRRKYRLSKGQCSEMFPVTQFFAKALDNAEEKEKRLKIERQLEREKRLLRTVIDHIPDAIYLKDQNLRKILTNQADITYSGYEHEQEILGKTDREIFGENVDEIYEEIERGILETGIPVVDREEQFVNRKGEQRWLLTSKFPYRDVQGDITGVVGISRDITESKAVQEQAKLLSLVASQTTNGVIITDVYGKVEWINEGFTRLTGYSLEEMRGKSPGELLQGPDADPDVIQIMTEAIKKREAFEVELINYKKDGTPYWIHINCNPLRDEKGIIQGFMAIESDITEMMINREELIRAKHIAEKAQEAEKTFLTNISHEIRTPLNAIIGMTSLLKDTQHTPEQLDYLQTLDHSSRFLLKLITDILDLAKIESGKIEVQQKEFDLKGCLRTIQQTFQIKAQHKPVKVLLNLDHELPEYVKGDEVLFQQVLHNLMSNAEKFTYQGKIILSCSLRHRTNDDIALNITVSDTGIGMSEKEQERIFEKFRQVGPANSLNQKGTGLGLAITREIVELLGGRITVDSEEGKGTTFSFYLPFLLCGGNCLEKNQAVNSHPASVLKPELVPVSRVLIVEDNLINRKYISRLMDKLHIEYDIANNGKEAVELVDQHRYGLIFMDIHMPEMDGYEATQWIRNSQNLNQSTPIVAITASAMTEQKDKALSMGMNDYLTKPFTPPQLKEKLERYVATAT